MAVRPTAKNQQPCYLDSALTVATAAMPWRSYHIRIRPCCRRRQWRCLWGGGQRQLSRRRASRGYACCVHAKIHRWREYQSYNTAVSLIDAGAPQFYIITESHRVRAMPLAFAVRHEGTSAATAPRGAWRALRTVVRYLLHNAMPPCVFCFTGAQTNRGGG